MTSGVMVKRDTGINSRFRRQHGSGLSASPIALLISARNSVCPSAAALTVSRAAIMPLAPGRFSTITGWPRDCVSLAPICRARMSGELPAGEGTRMRIGFEGNDCAAAVAVNAARTHARMCFIGEPFRLGSLEPREVGFALFDEGGHRFLCFRRLQPLREQAGFLG